MSRDAPRQRRDVSRGAILVLAPFFRYSNSRAAYVLRGVGEKIGPVLTAPAPPDRRRKGHRPPSA